MRYGTVCSGVEAATLAWKPLGWKSAFFAEVDSFPCAVLAEKFGATLPLRPLDPENAENVKEQKLRQKWLRQINQISPGNKIPNLGDFTKIKIDDYEGKIDILTGGTPCQAFSMAGKRLGLEDQRGNLSLEFARLAFRTECRWIVWENVPGVLSCNQGKDFASFLSLLCGWKVSVPGKRWKNSGIITPGPRGFGLAWRVLDAQYTRVDGYEKAVPQRRRRLFVIGYTGDWKRAAAVLFEPGTLQENAGKKRSEKTKHIRTGQSDTGEVFCFATSQANAEITEGITPTLNCKHEAVICFVCNDAATVSGVDIIPTIRCSSRMAINSEPPRRLTPLEYNRAMGMPDGHTQISWLGKPANQCPDSHQYKACGNSQCVNVMRWIGQRIQLVESIA